LKKLKQLYKFFSPKFHKIFLQYPLHPKPRYGHGNTAHEKLFEIIDSERDSYNQILDLINEYSRDLCMISQSNSNTNPHWNNNYLPALDMILLFVIIAEKKPTRFIEIGSGHSTKMAYKAKLEYHKNLQIISIDPKPRVEVDSISDKIIRTPFEQFDHKELQLSKGDLLFIDNSHMVLPNSDSMVFFMEVLPNLPSGVLVHLHDIYLPFDYPQFMCDRHYNEQYTLAAYLLSNPIRYKTVLPAYFVSQDPELSDRYSDIWNNDTLRGLEQHGGSYWLEIQ